MRIRELLRDFTRYYEEVDEADDVHSFFFSKGVFRDALKNNVKKNVISDLLGHRNKEQLMKYLNLDSDRMFLCPLSLEETNLCMEVNRYD